MVKAVDQYFLKASDLFCCFVCFCTTSNYHQRHLAELDFFFSSYNRKGGFIYTLMRWNITHSTLLIMHRHFHKAHGLIPTLIYWWPWENWDRCFVFENGNLLFWHLSSSFVTARVHPLWLELQIFGNESELVTPPCRPSCEIQSHIRARTTSVVGETRKNLYVDF